MPHSHEPRSVKQLERKKSHLGRNASIAGFLIILALFVWIEASPLSANNFYFSHTQIGCGVMFATHNRFIRIQATLKNNRNVPFHYVSAEILLTHFTLKDGTVVPVNSLYVDRNSTYNATVVIGWEARSNLPFGGPNPVASIDYIVTIHVQEVAQPIVLPLTVPEKDLSC